MVNFIVCLVSSEASWIDLQTTAFSLCPHMTFLLCVHIPNIFMHIIISSYMNTHQTDLTSD